tara:strand:+ start:906 stop:1058 length:153 start_codon:yes stop_codon:yes gene_type:complete
MIMIDIVEWIVNLFILGLAIVLWGIGILIGGMILSILKEWIGRNIMHGGE